MIYLGVPGLSLSWVSQIGRYDSSGKVGQRWQQAHDGGELLTTDGEINLSYTERKWGEREQSLVYFISLKQNWLWNYITQHFNLFKVEWLFFIVFTQIKGSSILLGPSSSDQTVTISGC